MEVPLHELANYPRFHDAARAVFSLVESAIGDHGFALIEHCDDEALLLKVSGTVPDDWREGLTIDFDSDLMRWLIAGSDKCLSSQDAPRAFADHGFAGVAISSINLADGRRFGYLVALAGREFTRDEANLLKSAAAVFGFALDGETRVGHDRLTGLYSRSMFDDHLGLELYRARRSGHWVAVVLVTYAVTESNASMPAAWWLARIAERLQSSVRQGDTIARVGLNEIALVVPDLRDDAAARRVVQSIIDSLEDPFHTTDGAVHIRPFAGAALSPVDGFTAEVLFERAVAALERASERDDAPYLFYSDLRRLMLLNS